MGMGNTAGENESGIVCMIRGEIKPAFWMRVSMPDFNGLSGDG